MNKSSLAFKVNMYISIISIITFVLMIVIVTSYVHSHAFNIQKQNLMQQSKELGEIVETWIQTDGVAVRSYAKNPTIVSELATGNIREIPVLIDDVYSSSNFLDTVFITDKNGIVVADYNKSNNGNDVSSLPSWVACSRQGKKFYVDQYATKSSNGNVSFLIAAPVYGEGNKLLGMVAFSMDLEKFAKKYIYTKKYGEEGYAYITDDKGIVLIHAMDSSLNMTDKVANTDFTKRIINSGSKSDFFSYLYKNRNKYMSFSKMDSTPWYVNTTMYADDFKGIFYLIIIIGVVATLILVGTMGFVLNTIVSKPLKTLIARADQMSVGEGLDKEIQAAGFSELANLCASLNRLRTSMTFAMKSLKDNK